MNHSCKVTHLQESPKKKRKKNEIKFTKINTTKNCCKSVQLVLVKWIQYVYIRQDYACRQLHSVLAMSASVGKRALR